MSNEEEIQFEDLQEVVEKHKLPQQAPVIRWGPDFDERPDDEKIVFLKKFANSFNHALDMMQNERNELLERCAHLEKQAEQHRQTIGGQRNLIQKTTHSLNAAKAAYQEKINKLEAKLRELL